MRSCLDSLDALLIRKNHRTFVHVSEPKLSSHGSMVLATTGKASPRNAASIDHASPTIVSGKMTIYDDRINVLRYVNSTEKDRFMGYDDFEFDPLVLSSQHMQLLAKRMDITALESVISDTYDFLNRELFAESIVQTPCKPDINLTHHKLYCVAGHNGKELSKAMGIP